MSINESLATLPIFNGMSKTEVDAALAAGHHVEVSSGEHVITQGKMVRNLWFILKGQCQVTRRTDNGCQLTLATLGPMTQFGEMSFFHAAPHSADIVALTDMELVRLAREDYDALLEAGNPIALKIATNSLEQLAQRLRKTDQWITNLVCEEDNKPSASEWTTFREIIFRGQ
ncbi:MAG: cyclic nucleotide-binding domain-containing protein [Planctomycetota bacterium]